jgi:hypothetical protein
MNIQVIVAMEAYQIMLVTLMVTQENVLTVYTAVILPPPLGFLYGLPLRMIIVNKSYMMLSQESKNLFFSFHIPY